MASKVLDALQQMGQPLMTPQIMGPRPSAPPDRFLSDVKPSSSGPQMPQVAVEVGLLFPPFQGLGKKARLQHLCLNDCQYSSEERMWQCHIAGVQQSPTEVFQTALPGPDE